MRHRPWGKAPKLAKLRQERLGRKSEKLDPAQLALLVQLCETEADGELDAEDATVGLGLREDSLP